MHGAWVTLHRCPLALEQSLTGGAGINLIQKQKKNVLNYFVIPLESLIVEVYNCAQALDMSAAVLQHDAEERGPLLNPRPYFRLFAAWVTALASPDPALDANSVATLAPIAQVLTHLMNFK